MKKSLLALIVFAAMLACQVSAIACGTEGAGHGEETATEEEE